MSRYHREVYWYFVKTPCFAVLVFKLASWQIKEPIEDNEIFSLVECDDQDRRGEGFLC